MLVNMPCTKSGCIDFSSNAAYLIVVILLLFSLNVYVPYKLEGCIAAFNDNWAILTHIPTIYCFAFSKLFNYLVRPKDSSTFLTLLHIWVGRFGMVVGAISLIASTYLINYRYFVVNQVKADQCPTPEILGSKVKFHQDEGIYTNPMAKSDYYVWKILWVLALNIF